MNVLISKALADPQLLSHADLDGDSWIAWHAILKAVTGEELSPQELSIFREITGRSSPSSDINELWCVVGRRGGKSRIAALLAVYLSCLRDYREHLSVGERGTFMVIASDRSQARNVYRYVEGLLENSPLLGQMILAKTKDRIDLNNQISIEIHAASFRSTRGFTCIGCVADEISFWETREDSYNPDVEVLNAIRPAMSTIPNALLVAISSPYARRGALWSAYKKYYGQEGPVLVVNAPSGRMNPTIPQHVIDAAMEQDESHAMAEYFAEFRKDLESYVPREIVDSCTVPGRHELPPRAGISYHGFVDPAGGSGGDSMTLAVAHMENDQTAVLDLVREAKPPFSPEAVTKTFAAELKRYGISGVTGDRYTGDWAKEQFSKHGIMYESSDRSKSQIYSALLPNLNSGRVQLLDNRRLARQLLGLERRTSRGGRDAIDHSPRSHDDMINAAAGALVSVAQKGTLSMAALATGWVQHSDDALLKELPLERQSAAYVYESGRGVDLTFEGRNWGVRR